MNLLFIIILGVSAGIISIVGAAFSIAGLMKLFAGAPLAVGTMAGALEFCKMMAASFLHRNWRQLHFVMKIYMTLAVAVLMCITSMGIFGYLSYAYQRTASELKNTLVRIDYLESQQRKVQGEIDRVQKALDEIPASRITKKMEAQKEAEPHIQDLQKQVIEVQMQLRNENLKKLSFQMEIGPVVYVAELLNANTDKVATYLILLFVFVFDPLAVCMVLATSFALRMREEELKAATRPSAAVQQSPAA
ncbi:MAG: FlxA-like family protein [Bdellovibrionales bacterium]|nr:FlxA-like family protein [Bdellovibrionales bacterium]